MQFHLLFYFPDHYKEHFEYTNSHVQFSMYIVPLELYPRKVRVDTPGRGVVLGVFLRLLSEVVKSA